MTQQLDRIITIQQRTVTRDRFGSEVEVWADLDEVWASFRPRTATETFRNDSNVVQSVTTAAFRIRWRADVDETMRLIHEGDEWGVTGIIEVGRRDKLDLIATRS